MFTAERNRRVYERSYFPSALRHCILVPQCPLRGNPKRKRAWNRPSYFVLRPHKPPQIQQFFKPTSLFSNSPKKQSFFLNQKNSLYPFALPYKHLLLFFLKIKIPERNYSRSGIVYTQSSLIKPCILSPKKTV